MALTDTQIKKLKPSSKCTPNRPDKYSDGNGLQLWVRHTGTKVFMVAYRHQGKQSNITLGKYPTISLQQARITALEIKKQITQGINPKQQTTAKAQNNKLFGIIAESYHAKRDPNNPNNIGKHTVKAGTHKRDHNQYKNDIAPRLAHIAIDNITAPMILEIAIAIESRGSGDMARRAIKQIGAIFQYANHQGLTDKISPHIGLEKRLQPRSKQHFARIEFNQLAKLFHDIQQSNCQPLTKLAFQFICYTAVRTKELRFMTWQEIDWQARLWRIPSERMKRNRPHIVPLAPQAISILQTIKEWGLHNDYVFFNPTSQQPISENILTSTLKRLGYQGKMTGHGFRGLASTKLHELQYLHEAIELQLAHASDDKVSQAYNGAEHLPYRVQMMNDWANLIDDTINQTKV